MLRIRETSSALRETALGSTQYPGQSSNLEGSSTAFIKTGVNFSISEQLIPFNDPLLLRQMTRDMYFFDPIGGGVTDIITSIPFGEYTLSGLPEKEMLEKFLSSMEKTRILTTLPSLGVDFLADGAILAVLNFDAKKKIFDSIMAHNLDYATITTVPIFGASPLIDLKFPPNVLALFNSSDPRAKALITTLPQQMQAQIKAGTVKLEPENTLYLPRRSMTHRVEGISMLTRLLPIFLLEKALLRGTIELAHRRQKGITHIICVSGKTWVSTNLGLKQIKDLVNHDPKTLKPGTSIDVDFLIKNEKGKFQKVSKWIYQGYKQTIRVATEGYNHIVCTPDHKLMTLLPNLSLGLKESGQMKLGDYLIIDTQGTDHGNEYVFSKYQSEIIDRVDNQITLPLKMTQELAWCLGQLISDGSFSTNGTIIVRSVKKESMHRFASYMENIFGRPLEVIRNLRNKEVLIKNQIYKANTKYEYKSVIFSKKIVEFFANLGIKNQHYRNKKPSSHYKIIPDCIMQSTREHKLAFLSSYIDGSVALSGNNYAINIFIRSRKILYSIHNMLRDMGYASNVNTKWFKLNMNAYESARLCAELGLSLKAKRASKGTFNPYGIPGEIIGNWVKSRYVGLSDSKSSYLDDEKNTVIPEGKSYRELFKHFIYASQKSNPEYRPPMLYDKDYSEILALIKEISPSFYSNFQLLRERKYRFEKITKITGWKKIPVYDLTMAKSDKNDQSLFLANGILTKNCGDELWTPVQEELQGLADTVVRADSDPLGAVIATRSSVSISEISPGGAFWRYDESVEALTQMKMRALGMSEDIFGSTTLAGSSDNSMTMFMRQVENFRNIITKGIFYDKMFPYISIVNEFKNDGEYQEHGGRRNSGKMFSRNGNIFLKEGASWAAMAGPQPTLNDKIDISQYHIPKINWHISLKLDDMGTQMDKLQILSDAGVPPPLRTLVGAAGLNISDLINGIDEDLNLRKQIMAYAKQVNDMKMASGLNSDQMQEQSSAIEHTLKAGMGRPGQNRPGLLNRNWEMVAPYFAKRETGSHKHIRDAKTTRLEEERRNRRIAEQVVRLQEERAAQYQRKNKKL